MAVLRTKYFGKIVFDGTKDCDIVSVKYNKNDLNIGLPNCFINDKDKIKKCIEIMDKYLELNEIAKKAIISNSYENSIVQGYFQYHFDSTHYKNDKVFKIFGTTIFEDININNIIEKMECPDLMFQTGENDDGYDDENKITFWLNYIVSREYSNETLCVRMDKDFNVLEINHFNYKKNGIRSNGT